MVRLSATGTSLVLLEPVTAALVIVLLALCTMDGASGGASTRNNGPTWREISGGRLMIGAAVNYEYLTGESLTGQHGSMPSWDVANYTAIASREFSVVTAENALKMKQTEPVRGVFNFTAGDAVVGLAATHNISVRGHNLVWCAHNPMWVVPLSKTATQEVMDSVMRSHITSVATHYRGREYSWDVVNEAIVDVPNIHSCSNWTCALKGKGHMPTGDDAVDWTKAGLDYIQKAFR
jgi:GH35 family endo-1,4-beta-xylanase